MRKSHRVAHEDQRRGGFCCYYYTSFDVIVKNPFTVLPLSQYIMCHSLTLSVVICPFHVLHFSYISQIFLHILILYAFYHPIFAAIQDKLPGDRAVTMLGLGAGFFILSCPITESPSVSLTYIPKFQPKCQIETLKL